MEIPKYQIALIVGAGEGTTFWGSGPKSKGGGIERLFSRRLPQLREIKDALRGRTCCSTFLFFQISPKLTAAYY